MVYLRTLEDKYEQARAENERLVADVEEQTCLTEQTRARVRRLYDVVTAVKIGLAGAHPGSLGADCSEAPCTLCWLHNTAEEALTALAEGEADA